MTDVLEILELLPPQCASINATTGESILIARGVIGYYPAPVGMDVDRYNERHSVTAAQREAMEAGSIFGWEIPAADPRTYESEGG